MISLFIFLSSLLFVVATTPYKPNSLLYELPIPLHLCR